MSALDEHAFTNKNSAVSAAYRNLKGIIYHIYYTSEPANPDYMPVPGNFRGSVTQEEINKFNLQGRVT